MKTPANLLHRYEQGSFTAKKAISSLLIGCIASFFLVFNAGAQQTGSLPEVTITGTTTMVNQKVLQVFNKNFRNAQDPRWYMIENKYLAKYTLNDMLHKTLFRKRGGMVYDLGYGFEKDLPGAIKSSVKANYKDYAVTTAINVNQGSKNVWKINVEDDKHIIFLHAEDGTLIEQERISKAPGQIATYSYQESLDKLLADPK